MKRCPRCQKTKPETEFSKDQSKKDGHCSHCRECAREHNQSEKHRAWQQNYNQSEKYKANQKRYGRSVLGKARQKRYNQSAQGKAQRKSYSQSGGKLAARRAFLKKKYGLTLEDYDQMLAAQNGHCAICRGHWTVSSRHLAVDHNHRTGETRGLLCGRCNKGVGLFDDNSDMLEAAAAYIRQFGGL